MSVGHFTLLKLIKRGVFLVNILRCLQEDIENLKKCKISIEELAKYDVGGTKKMAKKYHLDRGAFGHALLTMRKRSGLSAEALANMIGVCTNTVSRWENNKILPSPRTWEALLKWADNNELVDTDQLKRAYAKALTEYAFANR